MALDRAAVEQALSEATRRPENLDFLLDHLTSAEWIQPLKERGLFGEPPKQFIDEERLVRAPSWAQSRYLARVANSAPTEVIDVIRSIDTNNERVVEDFVDAALRMEIGDAVRITDVLARFVRSRDHVYYLLPRKLTELAIRFYGADAVDDASRLVRTLFRAKGDPEAETEYWRPRAKARFNDWEYDMLLRKLVAEAFSRAPTALLSDLVSLLEHALTLIRSRENDADSDASRVWRVHIGDDRGRGTDVEEALTSAVRDAAIEAREGGLLSDSDLVALLARHDGELYRRIAMHALAKGPTPAPDVARRFVLSVSELTHHEPSPEYRALLRRTATMLTPQEISQLVEAVERGPDIDRYREVSEKYGEGLPTEDDVAAYVARWKSGRFELFAAGLPEDIRGRYDEMVATHGAPDLPLSYEITSFSGWESPVTAADLAGMADTELADFLRDWRPQDSPGFGNEPSVEGLARTFASLTESDPARVARLAPTLRGVKPAYLQWMVHSFENATGSERSFEWEPLLELLAWVVDQPRELETGRGDEYADLDPGWVWTRKAIAALIERGLRAKSSVRIPLAERERVWRIIDVIARDPEPPPDPAEADAKSDPVTASLNLARPRAIRAAIAYAIWVYQSTRGTDEPTEDGFFQGTTPEVAELLRERLDVDHAPAVRAVFGEFFPNLFAMDWAWVEDNTPRIFPDDPSAEREAAWGAYVIYTHPYDQVLELLRPVYLRSAELLAHSDAEAGFQWMNGDVATGLGDHLAGYLWRGALSTDDPLFELFWENATSAVRAHVVETLGRWARETQPSPTIIDRLQSLWALVVERVRDEQLQAELAPFSWWFVSSTLPSEWRLDELRRAVAQGVRMDVGALVLEELARLAPAYPLNSVETVRSMIELEDPWFPDASREDIERVLRISLTSSDAKAAETAYATVNTLLARGYRTYARVLDNDEHVHAS